MDKDLFTRRYFPDRKKLLEWATSENSYNTIVHALKNPEQEAIVAGTLSRNTLILAGPGSGKTRTVVHRCAFLLRVSRIPASSILVLTFNHSAALSIRKRLTDLVGNDARGLSVMTYHALAMRLTGHAFTEKSPLDHPDPLRVQQTFNQFIKEATELLTGKKDLPGFENDSFRERILGGYRFILVDEYQDIDQDQYDLIAAISGKHTPDLDHKLHILAVGDDDQSIYGFRNANITYIRRFMDDYKARTFHLVENYRSTDHIITGSQSLIFHNRDRMKKQTPIIINKARKNEPKGGLFETMDSLSQGKIQIIPVSDLSDQAGAVVSEIRRLKALCPDLEFTDIAVFARNGMDHDELNAMRSALDGEQIPCSCPMPKESSFSFSRVREFTDLCDMLKNQGSARITVSKLIVQLKARYENDMNGWIAEILSLLESFTDEAGDGSVSGQDIMDYLFEAASLKRREHRLGQGVFLSTAHGAKGLEFKVVFILDGAWKKTKNPLQNEEERRLYYVAMTRARDLLVLLSRTGESPNPHIPLIDPDTTLTRFILPGKRWDCATRSALFGMKRLFLDFAGRMIPEAPAHKALHNLKTGDLLGARSDKDGISLITAQGIPVARLSQTTAQVWHHRLHTIIDIRIIALIIRHKHDVDPAFMPKIMCDSWQVPMLDVRYRME
jgi:ATP-dependent DNA helicase RecQ